MHRYKILIADDHEISRTGIKKILQRNPEYMILDEAANGEEAVELAKYKEYDLIIIDMLMPKLDGAEAIREIKKYSNAIILVLSAVENKSTIDRAILAGADGYITKDVTSLDLLNKISSIFESQELDVDDDEADNNETKGFTKREKEILKLIGKGKKNAEIADALNISVRTVETHRYNIKNKIGIKGLAPLVKYAIEQDL